MYTCLVGYILVLGFFCIALYQISRGEGCTCAHTIIFLFKNQMSQKGVLVGL